MNSREHQHNGIQESNTVNRLNVVCVLVGTYQVLHVLSNREGDHPLI